MDAPSAYGLPLRPPSPALAGVPCWHQPSPSGGKGIPGLVTGVPGLPRTAALRIIGNGCVPHQAAAALRLLTGLAAAVPGATRGAGTGRRAAA
jgi:DNA (cytosine-5)-methyltransferase 1